MDRITIQIQTVLYHNEISDLKKSISNIANAVRVFDKTDKKIVCDIYYGDASKIPLFTTDDIDEIEKENPEINKIKYLYFDENTGTSKGHNKMAAECSTDYLVVMNPDVLVCPRFFVEMLKPFSDKNVGLTEARQTPIEHPKDYNINTLEPSWSTGACMCMPTAIYKEVNGFDEGSFFMYCDDVDLSWRIRLAGYKLVYRPNAPVFHAKRLSSTGAWQPTDAERYYSAEAALFMAYKWSNKQRLNQLLWDFKRSKDQIYNKAALEFKNKQKAGKLPEQLDPDHKIATFIEGEYAKHRFTM